MCIMSMCALCACMSENSLNAAIRRSTAPTRQGGGGNGRLCGGETSDAGIVTRQGRKSGGDDKQ